MCKQGARHDSRLKRSVLNVAYIFLLLKPYYDSKLVEVATKKLHSARFGSATFLDSSDRGFHGTARHRGPCLPRLSGTARADGLAPRQANGDGRNRRGPSG